jgi:uncharacterized protein
MDPMVEAAREYIKKRFLSEMKPEDGYYRYTHSLRVADIGCRIAREEGLDAQMLALACLLHDIGYVDCKKRTDFSDHGLLSARIAEEFLREQGYDGKKAESICYGIRIHTQPEEEQLRPATALEASVSDADNIDRFDAWRFSRILYWDGLEKMKIRQMKQLGITRRSRTAELRGMSFGTETGRRLWQKNLDLWEAFYGRLEQQMETTLRWDPEI